MRVVDKCIPKSVSTAPPVVIGRWVDALAPGTVFRHKPSKYVYMKLNKGVAGFAIGTYFSGIAAPETDYEILPNAYLVTGEE